VPGDNVVSSTDLYGGTWNLFANTLPSMGITVRFADPADPEAFRRATDDRTRAYYAETLPNPKLTVFPIGEVAAIGRELGVPLIMDNTAAPMICRPFDHGAAIVVHSTPKYIGGHGTSIGGIIVDGGNFDWAANAERFATLNTPDPSYHGAVWTEAVKPLGPIAYIIRARVVLLRDMGACMSPLNAFQFIQGLETLPLRMREHCRNAAEVALYLQRHPEVTRVIYEAAARQHLSAGRAGRSRRLRAQVGPRGRCTLHRCAQALLSRGQHRRCTFAGHPSLAAQPSRSARQRRHARLRSSLGRDRAHRRHHRRSRSGAGGGDTVTADGQGGLNGSGANAITLSDILLKQRTATAGVRRLVPVGRSRQRLVTGVPKGQLLQVLRAVRGTPLTEHGNAQSGQLSGGQQTTSAGRSRSISRLFVTLAV